MNKENHEIVLAVSQAMQFFSAFNDQTLFLTLEDLLIAVFFIIHMTTMSLNL